MQFYTSVKFGSLSGQNILKKVQKYIKTKMFGKWKKTKEEKEFIHVILFRDNMINYHKKKFKILFP